MKSRNLILLSWLSVGVGALLYFLPRAPESGAGLERADAQGRSTVRDEEPLVALAQPATRSPEARGDGLETSLASPPEREAEVASPASPSSGLVVRGLVRFAGDGAPAAGVRFVLHHAGGHLIVDADDQGRFETAPVVSPGVARLWHKQTETPGPYAWRLAFEPSSIALAGSSGEVVEVELTLLAPEAVLSVEVVTLGGQPAAGASVQLELQHEPRPEEFAHRMDLLTTQADGRASFALLDLEHLRAAGLIARRVESAPDGRQRWLVSEHLRLELPVLPERLSLPLRLVLDEAGSLLARVTTADGEAVPDEGLWIGTGDQHLSSWCGSVPRTDERGEALVLGLTPGEYELGLIESPGGERRRVALRRGEQSQVEFVLPAVDTRLAAAGRVVDEAGQGLAGAQVHVRYGPRPGPGDMSGFTSTDADGRFEFRAEPSQGLTLTANRAVFGDEFEPESIELPFGSREVLFRRVRAVTREAVSFEIVDAASGERLDGALVMTYRAPDLGMYSFHRSRAGLASPLCSDHPGTTLVIELAGYRRATTTRAELLAQAVDGALPRVALERGLLRRLHVEGEGPDGESAPVVAARVLQGGRLLGRTDAAGELEVDLYSWPEDGLGIEAEGFESASWLPSEGSAELEPAFIWLQRN